MAEGHLAFLLKQTDQIHDIENNWAVDIFNMICIVTGKDKEIILVRWN